MSAHSPYSLLNHVALVTDASSGLGGQVAQALVRAGAAVGLAARRKERIDEEAARLRAGGAKAAALPLDVRGAAASAQLRHCDLTPEFSTSQDQSPPNREADDEVQAVQ